MKKSWNKIFIPKYYLSQIDVEDFIEKNEIDEKHITEGVPTQCLLCKKSNTKGLRLNNNNYVCEQCFKELSYIHYPEIYENSYRDYLKQRESRRLAYEKFRDKNIWKRMSNLIHSIFILTILSLAFNLFIVKKTIPTIINIMLVIILYAIKKYTEKLYHKSVDLWSSNFPEPEKPILRSFYDLEAELSQQDKNVLEVFNHWPGLPPYWGYIRRIVIERDNKRCQIIGCPSRLKLQVHHKYPKTAGGSHDPGNLITLCIFHHALEPDCGHELIWDDISDKYFCLVREHVREGRVKVRRHLRRKKLITYDELEDLHKVYGFICPNCKSVNLTFLLQEDKNLIQVNCNSCKKKYKGPQELPEETGPKLAEYFQCKNLIGCWKVKWEILDCRQNQTFKESKTY